MQARTILLTTLIAVMSASFGCARITPPPAANLGSLALPADKGQTQATIGMATGGEILGGGGAGFQFRATHQFDDKWRIGGEYLVGAETSKPDTNPDDWYDGDDKLDPAAGGTVQSARLVLRHDLLRAQHALIGIVFGAGGGHYTKGNLMYATADAALPFTLYSDIGALYIAPVVAISAPVQQDGLILEDDEEAGPYHYPTMTYGAVSGGASVNIGEHVRYLIELTPGAAWQPYEDTSYPLVALSSGFVAQF